MRPILLLALLVTWIPEARADWQGSITVLSPAAPDPIPGTIYGRVGVLRMDMVAGRAGQKMSMLIDQRAGTAMVILPAMKAYLPIPLDPAQHGIICDTKDVPACLAQKGFHKTGREKVAGHPCMIYEGEQTSPDGRRLHVKAWHPTDLPEVPTIRTIITDDKGQVSRIEMTDVHITPLSDDLFKVPSDYQEHRTPH